MRRIPIPVLLSALFIGMMAGLALGASFVTAYEPLRVSLAERLLPPLGFGGTVAHPLGTDSLGRDIATRIVYGGRVSLTVGAGAVLLGGSFGLAAGVIAGYKGGRLDSLFMRLADIQLALPFILLALAVLAVLGPGVVNVIVVLSIGQWVDYARVSRSEVLSLREREFVQAARVIGRRDLAIVWHHIVPNVMSTMLVIASLAVGNVILAEASLSFLGAGVGIETPSWGGMVAEGRDYSNVAWWVTAVPGLALMFTVLAINLIGDWLRDVLDPRLQSAR